jgi:hypothetical protein
MVYQKTAFSWKLSLHCRSGLTVIAAKESFAKLPPALAA